MSEENNFSKKGERKLSSFIGQELLYDYITGQLDEERKVAVEEFLKDNREVQGDILKINNGIAYVDRLAETVVSQSLMEQIKQPNSYLEVVLMKIHFDQWPSGLRLGLEALLVAAGITAVAVVVPWHKLMSFRIGTGDLILTEIAKKESEIKEVETESPPEFVDEAVGEEVAKTQTPTPKPSPTPTPAPTKTGGTAAVAVATETTPAEQKRQGYLYRGSVDVTNVAAVNLKLVEKINELGGRKAGEVELGWRRGDGSYFHFTIPESKYEDVMAAFNEYGNLQLNKEKHERVMPEGIIRLIINVNEKKKPGT